MATIENKIIISLTEKDIVAVDFPSVINNTPEIIYHYTSIQTLKAILDKRQLRLTNLRNFSDTSEYLHGLNLLIKGVSDYEYEAQIDTKYHIPSKFFVSQFLSKELYAICFTEKGDNLRFWNSHYVPKEQSISIGFNTHTLNNDILAPNKCHYRNNLPRKINSDDYNCIRNVFNGTETKEQRNKFISLTLELAHFKNKIFIDEKEWRCVAPCYAGLTKEITYKGDKERSYIYIPINIQSISEIVIGPGGNSQINHNLVENIVREYGIGPKIVDSQLPYHP